MCVIMTAMSVRPTPEMVRAGWKANKDGGGYAFRDLDEAGEEVVKWKKNLSEDEMLKAAAELPLPFILHFRVASQGGVKPELCHPFEVERYPSRKTEGETKGYVLFHNGDWNSWHDTALQAAVHSGVPLPIGFLSDSKIMAWLCSLFGINMMTCIKQKGIAFSPDDMEFFNGNGWYKINDVWCSNDFFWGGVKITGVCHAQGCNESRYLDSDRLCIVHRKKAPVDPTDPSSWPTPKEEVNDSEVTQALVRMSDPVAQIRRHREGAFEVAGGPRAKAPFPMAINMQLGAGRSGVALMIAENFFLHDRMSKGMLKRIRKVVMGHSMDPLPDDFKRTTAPSGPRLVKGNDGFLPGVH